MRFHGNQFSKRTNRESKPKGAIVDVTVELSGFQINKIIYVYFRCEGIEQAPF